MKYIKPKEIIKFLPYNLLAAGIYVNPYIIPLFGILYFYRVRLILKFFKKILNYKKKIDILEVGAGIGLFSLNFKKNFPNKNYYLADLIKKENYQYLQKIYLNKFDISLKIYSNIDIQKRTTIENQSFDLIFALDVLEHIFDPKTALYEIRRILRKNGLLFISVPSETPLIKYLRKGINFIKKNDINPYHWQGLIKSEEDFFNLLTQENFKILIKRKFPINSFPRLFSYDIFYLVKK